MKKIMLALSLFTFCGPISAAFTPSVCEEGKNRVNNMINTLSSLGQFMDRCKDGFCRETMSVDPNDFENGTLVTTCSNATQIANQKAKMKAIWDSHKQQVADFDAWMKAQ